MEVNMSVRRVRIVSEPYLAGAMVLALAATIY